MLAAVAFAVTTRPADLVLALQRLHAPDLVVTVLSFMVRYLGVVTDELRRMRVARESRAFTGRGPRAWPVLAAGSGALFVRSYERGERVHLAMLEPRLLGPAPRRHRARGDAGPVGARPGPGSGGADGIRARAAAMTDPVLDVRGVAYAYPGGHQALFGVDLHVHRGERVALLGPNGAGKTTLVLHLNGILVPGRGSVTRLGPAGRPRHAARGAAAGGHRLPGPGRPALHADGA